MKIYGGWWIWTAFGQRVRLVTRCEAPDVAIYAANFKARRGTR